jgi:hypothetical protein
MSVKINTDSGIEIKPVYTSKDIQNTLGGTSGTVPFYTWHSARYV